MNNTAEKLPKSNPLIVGKIEQLDRHFDQDETTKNVVNFYKRYFKDKLTIYDWSVVSPETSHIATDSNGQATPFKGKPHLEYEDVPLYWIGFHIGDSFKSPFTGDWRESLEARPQDLGLHASEPSIPECMIQQNKADFDNVIEATKYRPPEEALELFRELKTEYRKFNTASENIKNIEKELRSIKCVVALMGATFNSNGYLQYDLSTCQLHLETM